MVLRKQSDGQTSPLDGPSDGVPNSVDRAAIPAQSSTDQPIQSPSTVVNNPDLRGQNFQNLLNQTTSNVIEEDSGSDWDKSDFEEANETAEEATAAGNIAPVRGVGQESFPVPLRPSESIVSADGFVLRRSPTGQDEIGNDNKTQTSALNAPAAQPEPFKNNNPFLRRLAEEKIPVDTLDMEHNVWSNETSAQSWKPQLPPRQIPRKAVPGEVSHDFASGEMIGSFETYAEQAPSFRPPIVTDHVDNPWKDIDLLDNKGGKDRIQHPISSIAGVEGSSTQLNTGTVSSSSSSQIQRPQIDTSAISPPPRSAVQSPNSIAKRQRNEVYQIKHIRWYDVHSQENPRVSPILIQNANGPCPLLALVNALVLSTPTTIVTALVETLRTREQVSLGLLLDAVFDELMSGRRGETAQELPDVGELYSFLITLHTGMNVNPRFVPPSNKTESLSLIDLEPHETTATETVKVGGFEDTREMRLYSTFSIPLIHGWLPHEHDAAFSAFGRTAQTYEDAQNIQAIEEDLVQKSQSGELTQDEQALYMDLNTMKRFFSHWPTQLTSHGLEMIGNFLKPGQISILFRNDHFSTLYKEPKTNQLMTLVTDAGYATHDEIVWESLVDINGTHSELFAGDFKSVSHNSPVAGFENSEAFEDDTEWTTVEAKGPGKGRTKRASSVKEIEEQMQKQSLESGVGSGPSSSAEIPPQTGVRTLSAAEQEDHDLALAMQLQEEEEQRERNDAARRRQREEELSQQFLARETSRQGPEIPPRRSNTGNQSSSNSLAEDSAPPPPYEQATGGGSVRLQGGPAPMPGGFGTIPNPNIPVQYQQQPRGRRRPSARQSLVDQIPPPGSPATARRQRGSEASAGGSSDDKCVMM